MSYLLPRAQTAPRRRLHGLRGLGAVRRAAFAPAGSSGSVQPIVRTYQNPTPTTAPTNTNQSRQRQNQNSAGAGAGANSWLQQKQQGLPPGTNWWNQQQAALNPAGGPPSTILKYDASGNPVYAVPPPGQVVTGYDAQGTPLYGNNSATATVVTGYDASGNPIYSSSAAAQAAGLVITGYDAQGNPIYSSSTNALTSAGTPATAAAAPVADTTSSYQSILDWLSESTLISGLPNWGIVAGAGILVVWLQNRKGR